MSYENNEPNQEITLTNNITGKLFSFLNVPNYNIKKIVLDATDCRKISVGRILSMKGVLDEHRYSSRKYIDHTVVLVNSRFARFILRAGLAIIRTERPVYISTPTSHRRG